MILSQTIATAQDYDTSDSSIVQLEDGVMIKHLEYDLKFSNDVTYLYDKSGYLLHRAYKIDPLEYIEYRMNEIDEWILDEISIELNDYVRVQENFGTYIFCLSARRVVSPILDSDAQITVVSYREEGRQHVTIQYESNGKQGFFNSETELYSDAKYVELYLDLESFHAFANSFSDPTKRLAINMHAPNEAIVSAQEITYSENYTTNVASDPEIDEWYEVPTFLEHFYMLRTNEKYGILTKDLIFTIAPIFDAILPCAQSSAVLIIQKDGKFGLIDLHHHQLLTPIFDEIPTVTSSIYPPYFFGNIAGSATKTGMDGEIYPNHYSFQYAGPRDEEGADVVEWGIKFCDEDGVDLDFKPIKNATSVEDGIYGTNYYYYATKKKKGICTSNGETVLVPAYDFIFDELFLGDEYTIKLHSFTLKSKKSLGMYLPHTNTLIEPNYSEIYPLHAYSNNTFIGWTIKQKNSIGFMNPEGTIIFPCNYSYIDQSEYGLGKKLNLLSLTTKKGLQGIGTIDGEILVEPIYESLTLYEPNDKDTTLIIYNGFMGKKSVVGRIGSETVIEISQPLEFEMEIATLYETQSILDVRNGKYGMVSLENQSIFPFEFEHITSDSEFAQSNIAIYIAYKDEKYYPLIYNKVNKEWISTELKGYDAVERGKGIIHSTSGQIVTDLFTGNVEPN